MIELKTSTCQCQYFVDYFYRCTVIFIALYYSHEIVFYKLVQQVQRTRYWTIMKETQRLYIRSYVNKNMKPRKTNYREGDRCSKRSLSRCRVFWTLTGSHGVSAHPECIGGKSDIYVCRASGGDPVRKDATEREWRLTLKRVPCKIRESTLSAGRAK